MTDCLISFGANLGSPAKTLQTACQHLASASQIRFLAVSRLIASHPAGGPAGQPQFSNAVIRVESELSLLETFKLIQEIEYQLGRSPAPRWHARAIDLDLLLFGNEQITSAELVVPHPRMSFRRFVLEPAVEVAADLQHPRLRLSLEQLLQHLCETPAYIAIASPDPDQAKHLADEFCALSQHRLISDPGSGNLEIKENPSSHDKIELLRARSTAVANKLAVLPADVYAVSPFWCEQVIADAPRLPESEMFAKEWSQLRSSTPRARLLVWLDNAVNSTHVGEASEVFNRYVASTSAGPVLQLAVGDHDWNLQELQAAVEAMRETVIEQ